MEKRKSLFLPMPTTVTRRSAKRFRAITFIEVLIAMALIALVASVVGINAHRAWKEQRFFASVEAVADRVDLAQQLMTVHQIDVRLGFRDRDGGWKCWVHADGELPRSLKTVFPPSVDLPEVKSIELRSTQNNVEELRFLALAQSGPRAIIVLNSYNGQTRYIALDDTRRRVRSSSREPALEDPKRLIEESQLLYPGELYEN